MDNIIILETENGEKVKLYAEEETRVNGISYLLAADSADDDATAYILKDISSDDEDEARYVMVEDETEFDAIADVFSRMIEDVDIIK